MLMTKDLSEINKTKQKISGMFDVIFKIQKDHEGKMREIQTVLQGLKQLRQGTALNILGEKLSDTEVNDFIAKIETKIKSLNVN